MKIWILLLQLLLPSSGATGADQCALPSILQRIVEEPFSGDPLHDMTYVHPNVNERISASHFSGYNLQSHSDGDLIQVHFYPEERIPTSGKTALPQPPAPPPVSTNNIPALVDEWMEAKAFSPSTRAFLRDKTIKIAKDPNQARELVSEIQRIRTASRSDALAIGSGGNIRMIGEGSTSHSTGLRIPSADDGPGVALSNNGINRYFWFKPKGASGPIPARILDIHQGDDQKFYKILVEYMQDTEGSKRIRNVAEVSLDEMKTARADTNLFTRERAHEDFIEELSPVEAQTKKKAESLKLKLFGYVDFGRAGKQEGRFSGYLTSPLTVMDGLVDGVEDNIADHFGSLFALHAMRPESFQTTNVVDLFSQLNPEYVLKKFNSKEFQYSWVITEDGSLKILPQNLEGDNLEPQLLRMASGRRIYSGGTFKINSDGSLNIRTNSNSYQSVNGDRYGGRAAFGDENLEARDFVNEVFSTQAKAHVQGFHTGAAKGYGAGSSPGSPYGGFSYGPSSSSAPAKTISWDPKNLKDGPASFEDWKKLSGSGDKTQWAHYVLNSNPSMKLGEISKKNYVSLTKQFHPDRNPVQHADGEFQKRVNEAMEVIRDSMK